MGSLLMSGAQCQEGAGGALRVDGLPDGGRVNNTQLIAPSLFMKNIVSTRDKLGGDSHRLQATLWPRGEKKDKITAILC